MRAKVFGSIETLSREISAPMRLVPLGEGDFSTLWRLCMESPSQPKLASSLPNKRLSYWRLTGFGRNDNEAGRVFVSICFLQTYDKASAAQLSNYPRRNQSFFHSPLLLFVMQQWRHRGWPRNADYILIARRAIPSPLNPLNLLNPLNPHAAGVSRSGDTFPMSGATTTLLHNPPPQAAITSSPAGAGHLPPLNPLNPGRSAAPLSY